MGDMDRYLRQVALEEIGRAGQERISQLKVLLVGAGGLGAPAAIYLAAAGVGVIGVVDDDKVELGNLQRQVIYRDEDIGQGKAMTAGIRLAQVNPESKIETFSHRLNRDNSSSLISKFDVVIGATDNFESRMVIAETCHDKGIPYVYGGINKFEVQVMSVKPGETACFACVYGEAEDSDEPARGPLGAVAGVGGTIQAVEALKIGAGFGEPLYNRLLIFDALIMNARTLPVARRKDCTMCMCKGTDGFELQQV